MQKKYEILKPSFEETKSHVLGQNHVLHHSHSERMVKAFS